MALPLVNDRLSRAVSDAGFDWNISFQAYPKLVKAKPELYKALKIIVKGMNINTH